MHTDSGRKGGRALPGLRTDLRKFERFVQEKTGLGLGSESMLALYLTGFIVFNLAGVSLLSPSAWSTYQVSNSNPPAGAFWIEGCSLHWADGSYEYYFDCPTETSVVDSSSPGPPGAVWIEGNTIHWIDANDDERKYTQGQDTGNNPSGASPGNAWIESYLHFIDSDGDEISTNEAPGSDT